MRTSVEPVVELARRRHTRVPMSGMYPGPSAHLGAQLYSAEGLEVKAECNAKIGGSRLAYGGSLRLAHHF